MDQNDTVAKSIEDSDSDIWNKICNLSLKHDALDLSTGTPEIEPPKFVIDALQSAVSGSSFMIHQYTRTYGHTRLVQALSKLYSRTLNRDIDPMTDIIVTQGAYQAIYYSLHGLIDKDDEVILIEPFYIPYQRVLHFIGAKPVYVTLKQGCNSLTPDNLVFGLNGERERITATLMIEIFRYELYCCSLLQRNRKPDCQITTVKDSSCGNDWSFDVEELRKAFNAKTKAIILINPMNPLGKTFSLHELNEVCALCIKHDALCISDEVNEWLVYDGKTHIKTACIPGMWNRTVTIGSAGKAFCVTGWKLGWAVGPKRLIKGLMVIHDLVARHVPTITQEAVSIALEIELSRLDSADCFFRSFSKDLQKKRDIMMSHLAEAGIPAIKPNAGFFILADISKIDTNGAIDEGEKPYDCRFVEWAIMEKQDDTLKRAGEILKMLNTQNTSKQLDWQN